MRFHVHLEIAVDDLAKDIGDQFRVGMLEADVDDAAGLANADIEVRPQEHGRVDRVFSAACLGQDLFRADRFDDLTREIHAV